MELGQKDRAAIANICRRYGILRLSLFGSAARDDLNPESDIDILVNFEPGRKVGFDIFEIENQLSEIFGGRRVDIVREKYLNHRLRKRILAEAIEQYAER